MLKIKEEFDYKSLSKRLEMEIDRLICEHERQQKVYETEIERIRLEAQKRVAMAERNYVDALEVYLHLLASDFCISSFYLTKYLIRLEG